MRKQAGFLLARESAAGREHDRAAHDAQRNWHAMVYLPAEDSNLEAGGLHIASRRPVWNESLRPKAKKVGAQGAFGQRSERISLRRIGVWIAKTTTGRTCLLRHPLGR